MALSEKDIKELTEKVDTLLRGGPDGETIGEARGRHAEALRCLDIIIANSAPHAFYFYERALVRIALHRADASEDLTNAIALDPDRPAYYVARADHMFRQKSDKPMRREVLETALTDYKTALHKDPALPNVWIGLIVCNILSNDWDEVISLCGQSKPYVKDSSDKAVIAWLSCLALTLAGDSVAEEDTGALQEPQAMAGVFERVPSLAHVGGHVVTLCIGSEIHSEKVLRILDMCLMLNPFACCSDVQVFRESILRTHYEDALRCKANLLDKLERYEEAVSVWYEMQKVCFMFSPFESALLSDRLERLSRYPEALKALKSAMHYPPTNRGAWLQRGKILEKMGRYEEAIDAYSKAAEPNPDDWYKRTDLLEPLLLKARLLVSGLKRYEEALEVFDNLFTRQPNSAEVDILDKILAEASPRNIGVLSAAWYQKARVSSFKDDHDNAGIYLSKAIGLDPKKRRLAAKDKFLKDILNHMSPGQQSFKYGGMLSKVWNLFRMRRR